MKISDIKIEKRSPGRLHLSTVMNNEPLWFDIPEPPDLPTTYADSFMIMGLAGSMLRREPLMVSDKYPVSSHLLENINAIQKILNRWNPAFQIIPVDAVPVEARSLSVGVASFFSGGVDSIAALITNRDRVDSALYIGGFDFAIDNEVVERAVARNKRILDHLGTRQIMVHSNQQKWGTTTGVARNFWHSGYLAAAAFLTEPAVFLVPSTHTTAELSPAGSHLVLDHLWDNGSKALEHVDADISRTQKIEKIVKIPEILENLHVCWRNSERNCGICAKCIRTMITLRILGVTGPFPRVVTNKEISRLKATTWEDLSFLIDNAMFAHQSGHGDIVRALKKAIRRYDRSKALEDIDRGVFGGFLRRLRMKYRPYTDRVGFTNGRPDLDI